MKSRTVLLIIIATFVVGGVIFGFTYKSSNALIGPGEYVEYQNCPKKGQPDCPLIQNCPKKGTADCPYTKNQSCCDKKKECCDKKEVKE